MNSKTLTTEIESLEKNRARLQSELESAESAHTNAREGLVQTGDKQNVLAVTETHSRASALREALSSLDAELEQKQAALAEAQANEKRQAVLDRIGEIGDERDRARVAYLAARERANEALQGPLNDMRIAWQKWRALGVEQDQLSARIGSGAKSADRFKVPPVEPFGVQVSQAFHVLGRIEERARDKARIQLEQRRARERAVRAA